MKRKAWLIGAVALSLYAGGARAQAQGGGATGSSEGQGQQGQGQQGQDQGQAQDQGQEQQGQAQGGAGQGGAGAQAGSQAQKPMGPATPGPQDQAIQPVFGRGGTWTGQVPAGARGPNSPATTTQGSADCKAILGGVWYSCDVENRIAPGSPDSEDVLGHMIVGYDRSAQAYQATVIDNQGSPLRTMNGTLTGTRFVLETPKAYPMHGKTAKERMTFDFTDPNNIAYTSEYQVPGQNWTVMERATIHPRAPRAATGAPSAG